MPAAMKRSLARSGWSKQNCDGTQGRMLWTSLSYQSETDCVKGFHRYDRVKHAEVLALEQAGRLAKGATVYINLEPCCHRGDGKRTPPCTAALIEARVKRVVCCITDPNPRVDGRGVAALRQAGIAVTVGPRISAARILNAEYLRSVITANTSPTLSLSQLLF